MPIIHEGSSTRQNGLYKNILENSKCSVCLGPPPDHIYQCPQGHIVCRRCKSRLSKQSCPTCGIHLIRPNIRCRPLEYILQTIGTTCPFRRCGEFILRDNLLSHILECEHRPFYLCGFLGFSGCNDQLLPSNLYKNISHLVSAHNIHTTQGSTVSVHAHYTLFDNPENFPRILEIRDEVSLFRVVVICKQDELAGTYFHSILIGSEAECRRYRMSYCFTGDNVPKVEYLWPMLWYKDALGLGTPYVWNNALHVCKQSLQLVQGDASQMRLFIQIKQLET